tara:strand:- start:239 stop:646 length:408 start_codon:yes stop_codon:yes gene_type:complete
MGNTQTKKINFEDVLFAQKQAILISTLPNNKQNCLIQETIPYDDEEDIINGLIDSDPKKTIIIYGENSNDEKIYSKFKQLISLGFINVFIYTGGLFEWVLLQDIYGKETFKTTSEELDILKFRPNKLFGKASLCN